MSAVSRNPLRVGLVGAGFVSQHHLAGWQRHAARARVVAVADPSQVHAQARAQAFGIPAVYASAAAMFAAEQLDAVDIAAPREVHAELVRLAGARGIATLCQKPLAPTHDSARQLADDMAGLPGMRLMVHENWRFRPYYRQLAAWLRAGRIGRVLQAQMTLLSSGLLPDAGGGLPALVRQPFIATLQRALVMEVLIHHIDTLRYLLGDMAVAHARIGRSSGAMAGEDHATVAFSTAGGASVLLLANLATHGEPATLGDRLVVIGERGTIHLQGDRLRCDHVDDAAAGGVSDGASDGASEGASDGAADSTGGHVATAGTSTVLRYDLAKCYADSYAAAIGHFIDALAAGTPFETSPQDNLRTMRLVDDIYALAGRP